jgi:hypothetical protein
MTEWTPIWRVLGCNTASSVKSTEVTEEHVASISRVEEKAKQGTSMKAGGKQSNRLAGISDYVGSRMEMEDSKSVPIGSLVGQNE